MNQHYTKFSVVKILFPIICCLIILQVAVAQEAKLERQVREHYKPESWPKLVQPPMPGLRLDGFRFEGFQLKKIRYFSPAKGTNYIWHNEKEKLDLWIAVNVCTSVEAAHKELLDWLVSGTSALLEKGTLTDQEAQIGDISWADPRYNTLAFARRNVVIIMFGRTKKAEHRQLIENVATTIDSEVKRDIEIEVTEGDMKGMAPVIESVTLDKPEIKVNESARLNVVATDPQDGKLGYGYRSTGGNILRTKDGVLYQAISPGTHKITVLVVNQENIVSEKTISVIVAE